MENNNYIDTELFESKEYKRSRAMYMAQCTFEYFISILIADAFLAKLLTYIGISDSLTGIIASFMSIAFLFQLLSMSVAGKINGSKKIVIIFQMISQALFILMYLIPFLPMSTEVKTVAVVVSILAGQIGLYFVSSILFKWANSYVEPLSRGKYSAAKEMISLISGIIFTLIIGAVVDKFESLGNIRGAFLFISASILVCTVLNFVCLLSIKSDAGNTEKREKIPARDIIKNTFGNKNFRSVIVLTVIWDTARYFTTGFLGTFKTNDLLISVAMVQVINMIANLGRMAVSIPFGKYSDKHSYASGMKLAYIIAACAFGANMFTNVGNWWLIAVYTVLYSVSMAGSNANGFNIIYSYVDSRYFVYALAIKNSIGGLFGFAASLIGGRILGIIQANGNVFMGMNVFGQQILSGISFVLTLIAVLYIHFVIGKQKVMKQ